MQPKVAAAVVRRHDAMLRELAFLESKKNEEDAASNTTSILGRDYTKNASRKKDDATPTQWNLTMSKPSRNIRRKDLHKLRATTVARMATSRGIADRQR